MELKAEIFLLRLARLQGGETADSAERRSKSLDPSIPHGMMSGGERNWVSTRPLTPTFAPACRMPSIGARSASRFWSKSVFLPGER
jgi:hypothetical protein